MKPYQFLFSFLLVCLLVCVSPVLAQEDLSDTGIDPTQDPPETGIIEPQEPPFILSDQDSLPEINLEIIKGSPITPNIVFPRSETKLIATNPDEDEVLPVVAHGGSHYFVAYEMAGAIYAAVYTDAGDYVTTHTIADHVYDSGHASVSYEAGSGLFIVAYEIHKPTSIDIWAQAVSPTTGKVGIIAWIAFSSSEEQYPTIACNSVNHSCLVAFSYDDNETIKGRYVLVDATGIPAQSEYAEDLTNATHIEGGAFLAWGKDTGTYLLIYTWKDSGYAPQYAMFTHIYDYETTSTWYLHGNTPVAHQTWEDPIRSRIASGVAYDPCTRKYVVIWDYDKAPGDQDVYATIIDPVGVTTYGNYVPIAATAEDEFGGKIGFVTDPHLTAACGTMDKLVISYINASVGLMAGELVGNSFINTSAYKADPATLHLVIEENDSEHEIIQTSVSSGAALGEMLIAYQNRWVSTDNDDIEGMIVEVMARSYFPLLRKP